MTRRNPPRLRPPLDEQGLGELALAYVGKYATTRAKLAAYLRRKLRERGWGGTGSADVEGIVERLTANGYVDDCAYALSKSRTLAARGYGPGRLRQILRSAGVEKEDSSPARDLAEAEAMDSALRFARRRRFGPFADAIPDRNGREKAIAAMIRAGHSFELARQIIDLPPGAEPASR